HIRASGHRGCIAGRPSSQRKQAGYMAAPERFADTSDSSCTAGAVHTWHEACDIDRVGTLDPNRAQFLLVHEHITALGELIAPALVLGIDHLVGLYVHHLLAQPMPGARVDLVEVRLLRLGGRRI